MNNADYKYALFPDVTLNEKRFLHLSRQSNIEIIDFIETNTPDGKVEYFCTLVAFTNQLTNEIRSLATGVKDIYFMRSDGNVDHNIVTSGTIFRNGDPIPYGRFVTPYELYLNHINGITPVKGGDYISYSAGALYEGLNSFIKRYHIGKILKKLLKNNTDLYQGVKELDRGFLFGFLKRVEIELDTSIKNLELIDNKYFINKENFKFFVSIEDNILRVKIWSKLKVEIVVIKEDEKLYSHVIIYTDDKKIYYKDGIIEIKSRNKSELTILEPCKLSGAYKVGNYKVGIDGVLSSILSILD